MLRRFPVSARFLALFLVLSSVLGSLVWFWWSSVYSESIGFLPRLRGAEWIVYPSPSEAGRHQTWLLTTIFSRSFSLTAAPQNASLRLAGFRNYEVSVNAVRLGPPARRGRNWKDPDTFEISKLLRPGTNEILVAVSNSNGPPALWLALKIDGTDLASDETWRCSYADAVWCWAHLASKPRPAVAGTPLTGGEEPWASLQRRWRTLLLFAALVTAGCWLVFGSRRFEPILARLPHRRLLPVIGLVVLWAVLFANNIPQLPVLAGYDVNGHLDYIRYIQAKHALPQASDGWEMFQPPLYYAIAAGVLAVPGLTANREDAVLILRLVGLVIGVAHFLIVWASLRLLFPGEQRKPLLGLALAAFLPVFIYLSQYVTNEGLAAMLVSASLYLALRIVQSESASWRLYLGLGLCMGAALLTKSSALLVVPVVIGGLLWKSWAARTSGGARTALARLGVALGVCILGCGWHYARVWQHFGNPLIGNWDPGTGFSWWQDDGYRTGEFYSKFGESLVYPWFGSFKSFADGLYSTLWGDGLFGGFPRMLDRPPWNFDLMSVGYWLALPLTLGVLSGMVLAVVRFVRRPCAGWMMMLGFGFLTLFGVLQYSLSIPCYGSVRAGYALAALVPLCAVGAEGLGAFAPRVLRAATCALFGIWALNAYATFWVRAANPETALVQARSLAARGQPLEAANILKSLLEHEPEDLDARATLVSTLLGMGDLAQAAEQAAPLMAENPANAESQLISARLLALGSRAPEAMEHIRRAIELAPGYSPSYEFLAMALINLERFDEVADVARAGLAINPLSADLRLSLGVALLAKGDAGTDKQLALAFQIKPTWPQRHQLLATALVAFGRWREATDNFREALRLKSDFVPALNGLAWLRATCPDPEARDGAEAMNLAKQACQLTEYKDPTLLRTLAAAYAEAGRFDEALSTIQQANSFARQQNQGSADYQKLMDLFTARTPYRDSSKRVP